MPNWGRNVGWSVGSIAWGPGGSQPLWTPITDMTGQAVRRVMWSNVLGQFLIMDGGSAVWMSTDGVTWPSFSFVTITAGAGLSPPLNFPAGFVEFNNAAIGVASYKSTPGLGYTFTSVNGTEYTMRVGVGGSPTKPNLITAPTTQVYLYGGTAIGAVGDYRTSTNNGTSWSGSTQVGSTDATRPSFTNFPMVPQGTYSNGVYFVAAATRAATTDTGGFAAVSATAANLAWTQVTSPVSGITVASDQPGVWAANNLIFVTTRTATGPRMFYSPTGLDGSWTEATGFPSTNTNQFISKLLYTGRTYVMVMSTTTAGIGTAPSYIATSRNLSSWTTAVPEGAASNEFFVDAAWHNGTLVVLSGQGGINQFYSTTGTGATTGRVYTLGPIP